MGREVRRAHERFDWPLNKTWWGYQLDPIRCQACRGVTCPTCDGEGKVYPKVDPPAYELDKAPKWIDDTWSGERYGWQMWETTSEGSPISPVCDTPEELARWLADSGASSFGSMTATYEQWLSMITSSGYAPSAMLDTSTGIMVSGVEAVAEQEATNG